MTFPANDLEVALLAASRGEQSVQDWLRLFRDAAVWAPLEAQGQGQGAGSGSFALLSIDGAAYLAVFTSQDELERASGGTRSVHAPVRDLLSRLPAHVGIAVNPGGTVGLPLSAADARLAVNGASTIPAGTSLKIGDPAEEPEELLGSLRVGLSALPAVRNARRCWAAVGESLPALVLGMDVDPDSVEIREAVLGAVRAAVAEVSYLPQVDVVFDNDRSAFTEWMAEHSGPFFTAG